MSTADLDPLRDLILDDPEQVARLATLTDATDFVTMAVSLAEGHDLDVEPDNVGQAMNRGERRLVERRL